MRKLLSQKTSKSRFLAPFKEGAELAITFVRVFRKPFRDRRQDFPVCHLPQAFVRSDERRVKDLRCGGKESIGGIFAYNLRELQFVSNVPSKR
jgi:hypothetical protein